MGDRVPTSLDHLVYAAPNLSQALEAITRGFGVSPITGGAHPAWGTRNAIVPLSPSTYLEIIGPDPERPGTELPAVFGLNQLSQPRLTTWAAKANDLAAVVARAHRRGVSLGQPRTGSRIRPDGIHLSWELTDPLTVLADGLIPFLIDWGSSPHPGSTSAPAVTLVQFGGIHPDPDLVQHDLKVLGVDLEVKAGPQPGLSAGFETPRGRVTLT